MPKKFPLSILLSIALHLLLIIGFSSFIINGKKTNYSKNSGEAEIRARIRIEEYTPEVKKVIAKKGRKKAKKIEKKKETKPKKEISTKGKKSLGSQSAIAAYLSKVRATIVKYKYKSRIAKRLGLKGEVTLSFQIAWPNKVSKLKVVNSSSYASLDSSAIKTIAMVEDLPKMPSTLKEKALPVLFSIKYE